MEGLEIEQKVQELAEQTKSQITSELEKRDSEISSTKGLIEAQKQALEEMKEIIRVQGEKIADLSLTDKANDLVDAFSKSFNEQITSEDFLAFKSNKTNVFKFSEDLVSKAAAAMTTTQLYAIPGFSAAMSTFMGIRELDYAKLSMDFLMQYFDVTRTSNPNGSTWLNQVQKDGEAQFIACGDLKPLADFTFEIESSGGMKKVAVSEKACTELLEDFAGFETLVRNHAKWLVYKESNDKILNGTGTAQDPLGLLPQAGGFVLSTVAVPMVNNIDAIAASMLQMKLLLKTPTHLFVNPVDYFNMKMEKDTTGKYLAFNGNPLQLLNPLTIVETSAIPVGDFLLCDPSLFKIKIYSPYRFETGWENDDFRRNFVTWVAEMRLITELSSKDVSGFIYDSFASVKAAIGI